MIKRTLFTASALAALAAAPAFAQQHGGHQGMDHEGMKPGMMQGHGGMQGQACPMMQSMPTGPAAILGVAEELGLSADQVARLTELKTQADAGHQGHMQPAMAAHHAAAAALEGDDADVDAYARALQEATEHMVQGHVAMARVAVEAREVLTAEQRTKLDELAPANPMMMHGQEGQGGHGAGMGGAGTSGGGMSGGGHGGATGGGHDGHR